MLCFLRFSTTYLRKPKQSFSFTFLFRFFGVLSSRMIIEVSLGRFSFPGSPESSFFRNGEPGITSPGSLDFSLSELQHFSFPGFLEFPSSETSKFSFFSSSDFPSLGLVEFFFPGYSASRNVFLTVTVLHWMSLSF